jgi:hypothetical protein
MDPSAGHQMFGQKFKKKKIKLGCQIPNQTSLKSPWLERYSMMS